MPKGEGGRLLRREVKRKRAHELKIESRWPLVVLDYLANVAEVQPGALHRAENAGTSSEGQNLLSGPNFCEIK